jgi:hypothetical protein
VRKVEELVSDTKIAKNTKETTPYYETQEAILKEKLGNNAKIVGKKITISFRNEEELNFILNHIH